MKVIAALTTPLMRTFIFNGVWIMGFYKFIKIKGPDAKGTGFFVPRMYHFRFAWWELKYFGFQFVKERLKGWDIWWVDNKEDLRQAVKTLNELKKTRIFDFKVSK